MTIERRRTASIDQRRPSSAAAASTSSSRCCCSRSRRCSAYDNWRTGTGWAVDGPQAGYFPFYLSIMLGAASVYGLATALIARGAADRTLRHPRPVRAA